MPAVPGKSPNLEKVLGAPFLLNLKSDRKDTRTYVDKVICVLCFIFEFAIVVITGLYYKVRDKIQ